MGIFGTLFASKKPAPACTIHPDDQDLISAEDVVWWNTLSLDDCKSFERQDNVFRVAALMHFMEDEGLDETDATEKLSRQFPFYYWTLEQRAHGQPPLEGQNVRLPYVLKDRVNRALMNGMISKEALAQSTSFNALVRQLIQAGRV